MLNHRSFRIIILDLVTWLFITDWIVLSIGLILHLRRFSISWAAIYHHLDLILHGLEWMLGYDLLVILLYLILIGIDSKISNRKKIIEGLGIVILAPIWIPLFWYRRFVIP